MSRDFLEGSTPPKTAQDRSFAHDRARNVVAIHFAKPIDLFPQREPVVVLRQHSSGTAARSTLHAERLPTFGLPDLGSKRGVREGEVLQTAHRT